MRAKSSCGRRKRILIVDDHPLVREGLSRVIAAQPGLSVWGEAATVTEAWEKLDEGLPDAVIVDLSLPGANGIELIKDLHARNPEVPVLVLSMHDEALYAERALRAGAHGYLMKGEPTAKLVEALHVVLQGNLYMSPQVSERILHAILNDQPADDAHTSPVRQLSDREIQIFEGIGCGLSTRELSLKHGISTKTVETYRAHIKRKLGLSGNNMLIHTAIRWVEGEAASQAASAPTRP